MDGERLQLILLFLIYAEEVKMSKIEWTQNVESDCRMFKMLA